MPEPIPPALLACQGRRFQAAEVQGALRGVARGALPRSDFEATRVVDA
jgi:hypothetical protein